MVNMNRGKIFTFRAPRRQDVDRSRRQSSSKTTRTSLGSLVGWPQSTAEKDRKYGNQRRLYSNNGTRVDNPQTKIVRVGNLRGLRFNNGADTTIGKERGKKMIMDESSTH